MSVTPIEMNVARQTQSTTKSAHLSQPKTASNGGSQFITTTNMHLIARLFMQAPGGSGTVSTAKLIKQLWSTDFSKRRQAAIALGKRRSKSAVIPLTRAVAREEIWSVKAVMVTALGDIGDRQRADTTIYKALMDKNWWVQAKAAEAAAKLKDWGAVPLLLGLLRSKNKTVFKAARDALHKIKHRNAVAPLLKALGDPNKFVRGVAAAALGRQGDRRAVPALKVVAAKDTRPYVVRRAVRTLGKLGDPRAFATIVAVLNKHYEITKKRGDGRGTYTRRDTGPNWAAAKVLGKMKTDRAITALIKWTKNVYDLDTKVAVLNALGKTGSPRIKPTLMRVLTGSYSTIAGRNIQRTAAEGLSQFSADPRVKAALLKAGYSKLIK